MNFKSLYALSLFLNLTYATACDTLHFPFEEDADDATNIGSNSTGALEDDKNVQDKERVMPPRTATTPEEGKPSSTPPINIIYPAGYKRHSPF